MLRYQKGYIFNGYTFVVNKEDVHNAKNDMFVEATALLPDGWISVKERLPCHLQKALTCDAHGNIHIFTYFHGSRYPFNIGPNHPKFYEPTYWMPLPKPPKEEN